MLMKAPAYIKFHTLSILKVKGGNYDGRNNSMDCLTVLHSTLLQYERTTPVITGKSQKQRCFTNANALQVTNL